MVVATTHTAVSNVDGVVHCDVTDRCETARRFVCLLVTWSRTPAGIHAFVNNVTPRITDVQQKAVVTTASFDQYYELTT